MATIDERIKESYTKAKVFGLADSRVPIGNNMSFRICRDDLDKYMEISILADVIESDNIRLDWLEMPNRELRCSKLKQTELPVGETHIEIYDKKHNRDIGVSGHSRSLVNYMGSCIGTISNADMENYIIDTEPGKAGIFAVLGDLVTVRYRDARFKLKYDETLICYEGEIIKVNDMFYSLSFAEEMKSPVGGMISFSKGTYRAEVMKKLFGAAEEYSLNAYTWDIKLLDDWSIGIMPRVNKWRE